MGTSINKILVVRLLTFTLLRTLSISLFGNGAAPHTILLTDSKCLEVTPGYDARNKTVTKI